MALVTFDREAKALYIKLNRGRIAKTIPMWDGAFMDVSKDGKVIGLEIVFAESTPQEAIDAIIGASKPTQVARAKGIRLLSA
jgi:uncharacterized protein YuzE